MAFLARVDAERGIFKGERNYPLRKRKEKKKKEGLSRSIHAATDIRINTASNTSILCLPTAVWNID